jgi:hypothetical protein
MQKFVAVPTERDPESVRCFPMFTIDLERVADRLQQCQIPLFQILEKRKIDVRRLNAHHVKNVPGRKTDVQDCQRIQHPSFRGAIARIILPG